MYTDWTAIALLLFTAVPLLIVVATATYFVIQNDQKNSAGLRIKPEGESDR